MKLTIQHLAAYLPYGLRFYKKNLHLMQRDKHPHNNENNEKIIYLHNNSRRGKLLGLKNNINQIITSAGTFKLDNSIYCKNTFNITYLKNDKYLEWYKPILRPLSDLTAKELEEQGFWHHIDYLTKEKQFKDAKLKNINFHTNKECKVRSTLISNNKNSTE